MFVMVAYLKFVRTQNGKTLTHSGNYTYRQPDKGWCMFAMQVDIDDFTRGGWQLVEKTIKSTQNIVGGNNGRDTRL
jgi:hypothetical protein